MRNMWKKTLSLVLAIGVAASMLAIGLTASAAEPTLDNPGTDQVYLVGTDTRNNGTYTCSNLEAKPGEIAMRFQNWVGAETGTGTATPTLGYASSGDSFATVDTYDVRDLQSVKVLVNDAFDQGYFRIRFYVMDDDKDLRNIGTYEFWDNPGNKEKMEGTITVRDEAKALNIQTPSRIYFQFDAISHVFIEKIEVIGKNGTLDTITFTDNTAETVDGQKKSVQHNFVTISAPSEKAFDWYSDNVNILGEATFTFLNVDLKDGLTNIKAKWGTIGPPYTHGDGFMEVYAIQRDTGFAYRIGKLHLPEYTATVNWGDHANGFRVSHFEWDDASYSDFFTGRWDIKMVYKPSISTDNISFAGVYFYTKGDASAADENGEDILTDFTEYDRILDTYIKEDMVSNADAAWDAYAAVQQKVHAVAQDINIRLEARKLYNDIYAKYTTKLRAGADDQNNQYRPQWLAFDNLQQTYNDSYATVEQLQEKMDALEQAMAGLEPDNALAEAQAVYDVNPYRVIKYNAQLADAFKTLEFYLEDLADAVEAAEGVIAQGQGQYTDESWKALQDAITAGNDVLDQVELDSKGAPIALPDSADVRTALTDLLAAKDGLTTYYAMLQEKHAAYYETYLEAGLEGKYTTDSWNAFATAMNNAFAILDKGDTATKDELKGALTALETAKEAMVRIDKPLSEKVEATKTAFGAQGKYTDATWAALQEALTKAEAILNKTANTEQEVTDAVAAIEAAAQALAKVDEALSAKVAEVTETYAAQGQYTDESWDALQKALTAAQTLLEKDACTQKEADDALAALETAVEGLKTEDASTDPDLDADEDNSDTSNDDPEDGEKVPVTGEAISLTVLGLVVASGAVLTLSKKRR